MKERQKADWFKSLSDEDKMVFYDYFGSFKTYELWDWLIELLPIKDLKGILKSNKEDQE